MKKLIFIVLCALSITCACGSVALVIAAIYALTYAPTEPGQVAGVLMFIPAALLLGAAAEIAFGACAVGE